MGYNNKWVVLLTWCCESSKTKLNQNRGTDRLSVEMAGFVIMRAWFVTK
jgi:hypothetical protein